MGIPPGTFGDGGEPPDPTGRQTGGTTDPILNELLDAVITLSNDVHELYNIIINITRFLVFSFRALGKFLLHIWQKYVKAAITWLATHVQKLRAWLKRTIGPILARLEKIKKWYDTHILKQQLRMLQFLQSVRRILGILRIFHVKWAIKLDGALADLQNRIETSIAIVRGTLNQIINTLAIAFDPTMLITRNVLGASLLTHLAAVKRIFAYGYHGPLTAAETTFIDNNVGRYQTTTSSSHIAALASSGLTDYDKSELAASRAGISGATGAPPVL